MSAADAAQSTATILPSEDLDTSVSRWITRLGRGEVAAARWFYC